MWQQSGRMRTADDQHSGFLIGSNRITGCVPLPSHLPDPILSPPSCFSHSHLAPDLFSLLSTPLTPFPLFPPTSFILSFSSLSASPECALNFDIKKKEKKKKVVQQSLQQARHGWTTKRAKHFFSLSLSPHESAHFFLKLRPQ